MFWKILVFRVTAVLEPRKFSVVQAGNLLTHHLELGVYKSIFIGQENNYQMMYTCFIFSNLFKY